MGEDARTVESADELSAGTTASKQGGVGETKFHLNGHDRETTVLLHPFIPVGVHDYLSRSRGHELTGHIAPIGLSFTKNISMQESYFGPVWS